MPQDKQEIMNDELLINEQYKPYVTIEGGKEFKRVQREFIESCIKNKDVATEKWLPQEIKIQLPEKSPKEIQDISNEIISTIKKNDENLKSVRTAINEGRSKESWFAGETKKIASNMSAHEASRYLQNLDTAIDTANKELYNTILTDAAIVNKNPNLDGYIAEQYHAQTFNLNAEASGSEYRAKVLTPEAGQGYAKNSVDIEIVDKNGKVVRRYQSKYCKDADATARAYENGNYKGQQKLVPEDQGGAIEKKHTTVIEAPDGTTSKPLTKAQAKKLQKEAQSGNWNELNWNEYKAKDLAVGIGKQAGQAALMGAAIGVGFDVAKKVWNGEEIKGSEIVETALNSGADFGVKAAAAGALKVGIEKGFITCIPKGTPVGVITDIAYVGIEDLKVAKKVVDGDLTFKEGLEQMELVTVSTITGLAAAAEGVAYGAEIGVVAGPIGVAVGGFIGGTVGYMAGSKYGEAVVKIHQKIRNVAVKVVKTVAESVVAGVSAAVDNFVSGILDLF